MQCPASRSWPRHRVVPPEILTADVIASILCGIRIKVGTRLMELDHFHSAPYIMGEMKASHDRPSNCVIATCWATPCQLQLENQVQ